MIRFCFIVIAMVGGFSSFAQTSFLKDAAAKLDKALLTKDTVVLKQLLHEDLTYGHSNGWVESKNEVIKDLSSGKLLYRKIESRDVKWIANKDWATMRSTTSASVRMDEKDIDLKLHVLQVWLKTNRGWQLVARQSTKL